MQQILEILEYFQKHLKTNTSCSTWKCVLCFLQYLLANIITSNNTILFYVIKINIDIMIEMIIIDYRNIQTLDIIITFIILTKPL